MLPRFRRQKEDKALSEDLVATGGELPAAAADTDNQVDELRKRPRIWLWILGVAVAGILLLVFILTLAVIGFYDGLKDRAATNRSTAQEHYALGLEHLEKGDYELAVAEFEVAMQHDSNLRDLRQRLQEAKELARAQVTPTSETRRDAAALLYRQAVPYYESGDLLQAVAVLEELRSLDPDYQRENVETMLVTASFQLGLNAAQANQLEEAATYFEDVLRIRPQDEKAQEQLDLLQLYGAAINHWDQDWPAAIQALQELYALAPDYKDVQARLHNAHTFLAQEYADDGDWCGAAEEYAAAVQVFPLETDVDKRDDATFRCQATAEAPTPTATPQVTARPTATAGPLLERTPTPTTLALAAGKGQIAYTSYDAVRQRYDIYLVDVKLLHGMASQPNFSPGGGRLVFRDHDDSHLGLDILTLGTDSYHELTTHWEDSTPAWSPDAKQIVFASDKHGDRKWRIYVISPGEVRGEGEEWVFGQMPTWSPDGSRVVYHGCDERGDNCGVWTMKAGGFSPARLTTHPSDTAPSWSPDGSQVAFISPRSGNWEIYLADVASGEETRITDHPAADVAPTWSPDGKRLAFLSNRDGNWALYTLVLQSGQVQRIVATGDAYPEPVSERLSWVP
jgi:tetratricopeptide (TPR) repeat protein